MYYLALCFLWGLFLWAILEIIWIYSDDLVDIYANRIAGVMFFVTFVTLFFRNKFYLVEKKEVVDIQEELEDALEVKNTEKKQIEKKKTL